MMALTVWHGAVTMPALKPMANPAAVLATDIRGSPSSLDSSFSSEAADSLPSPPVPLLLLLLLLLRWAVWIQFAASGVSTVTAPM